MTEIEKKTFPVINVAPLRQLRAIPDEVCANRVNSETPDLMSRDPKMVLSWNFHRKYGMINYKNE